MFPNLHEDALGVCSKPGVNCLELWPSFPGVGIAVTTIDIFLPEVLCFLRGIRVETQICVMRMKSAAFSGPQPMWSPSVPPRRT